MILQKLLLVTYGIVVWVLIIVLSIFCIINIFNNSIKVPR